MLAGWMPVGFVPWDDPHDYGKPLEPLPTRADGGAPGRPHLPCDQFEFDQKTEATAWRMTGELLNRIRTGGCCDVRPAISFR